MGIKKFFGDIFFGDKGQFTPQKVNIKQVTIPAQVGWHTIAKSKYFYGALDLFWSGSTGESFHGFITLLPTFSWVGADTNPGILAMDYMYKMSSTKGLTKARIVYHNTTGNLLAELQVYNETAAELALSICSRLGINGNTDYILDTPPAGNIPGGYTSKEVIFYNGISATGHFITNGVIYATGNYGDGVSQVGAGSVLTMASGQLMTFTPGYNAKLFSVSANNYGALFFATDANSTIVKLADPAGIFGLGDTGTLIRVFKSTGDSINIRQSWTTSADIRVCLHGGF